MWSGKVRNRTTLLVPILEDRMGTRTRLEFRFYWELWDLWIGKIVSEPKRRRYSALCSSPVNSRTRQVVRVSGPPRWIMFLARLKDCVNLRFLRRARNSVLLRPMKWFCRVSKLRMSSCLSVARKEIAVVILYPLIVSLWYCHPKSWFYFIYSESLIDQPVLYKANLLKGVQNTRFAIW